MPCRSTHSRVRLRTLTCSLSPMPPTRAVYAALAKFRAPLEGLTAEDFIERDRFFRMGRAPVMVDILPEISGVDFDRVWQRRVEAVIDPQSGLTVPFISSEDLITAKLASGRPQDVADVAALRKAAESPRPRTRPKNLTSSPQPLLTPFPG